MNYNTKVATFVILTSIVVGGLSWISYSNASHIEQKTIEVVSKERLLKVSNNGDGHTKSTYVNYVYADDIYVVEDSLWNGHFSSGKVYASLVEGRTCQVTVSGYRIGFLSMFQNIIEADCQ